MKTKMAQFFTYSWRQKQRGQEDWFTPYTICYIIRIKGAKKIGLHHTPYITSSEHLKTSMGIVFYSLYQATVT